MNVTKTLKLLGAGIAVTMAGSIIYGTLHSAWHLSGGWSYLLWLVAAAEVTSVAFLFWTGYGCYLSRTFRED